MRNLVQYPITIEEIGAVIDTAAQRASDDGCIGSIDGFIFRRLLELIENEIITADQFVAYTDVKWE